MPSIRLQLFAAVAVLALLFCGSLGAQQLATLKVRVDDPSGAVVPGASVSLKNVETGAKRSATTGDNGVVVLPGLPPGNYELTVEASSFTTRTVPTQLTVGQIASLTVAMGVGARQETVTVQETAEGIDQERSDVSQVIDTGRISDLPISGRDFIDFVLLTPSVNVGRSTAVGAQSPFTETVLKLSFGGVRESHTSYFALDGVDYGTSISGVQRVSPSQDWVQEFRVLESPYSADTGRHLGSVVNTVTKSGTNNLHGTLYEFFRNNALNANNVLSAPGFNALRFNQFGAALGGPIRKDKNFFFLGYEGQRRAESPIYSGFILNTINPNPATCPALPPVGVFNPGCISINASKHFFGLQEEDLSSVLQVDNYDKFIVRTNHVLSEHTSLSINYLFNDTRKNDVRGAAPGEGLPSSYRNNPVRDQTLYGNLIHVLTPALTSDTLLQYGRRNFNLEPVGLGLEPAISIPNLMSGGGFVGSVRFYQEQRFQAAENLTYSHGNHTFKFGGEFQPVWTSAQVPLFSPGFGIFIPDSFLGTAPPFDGGPPFFGPTPVVFLFLEPREFYNQPIPARDPNFQAGLFAGPNEAVFEEATRISYTHKLFALYAQDQWRARSNLTLTFGLRWDVDVFPSAEDMKIQGKFHPTNWKNFQPRVSFAYAFNQGKGVVRGGFGLFTAPFVYSDVMVSWIGASEFSYMNNPLVPELQDPTNQLVGFGASGAVGIPGPFGAGAAFKDFVQNGAYPAPLLAPPFNLIQFPLGYAALDFPNPYSEQASLELEHQLGHDFYVTAGYQWIHAQRLPVYTSINGLPAGTTPYGKQAFTTADPNFGFVLYVKPIGFSLYNAGTVSIRKAFSHHYNFLANYTFSKSIDIATTVNLPNTPENYLRPDLDRSVGDNDVRHRFTLALLAETPKEWPRVLRDFKGSILMSAQGARHFTINNAGDFNGDGFPFPDRVGLSSRNQYKGAPYFNTDLRIQRILPFTERLKGEVSAEFFNLFNRVNVQDVNHVYVSPTGDFVGPVPQEFGDGVTDLSGTFGTPKFVAPARQIQFAFRLTF